MEAQLQSLKLSLLEVLYSELTNNELKAALGFVIKKLMQNDFYFKHYIKYTPLIQDLSLLALNSFTLYNFNSSIGEIFYDFIKINTKTLKPISSSKTKLLSYVSLQLCFILSKHFLFEEKEFNLFERLTNYFVKSMFLFKPGFVHSNLFDFLLNLATVRKGSMHRTKIIQVIIFMLYLFLKYGKMYLERRETRITENYFYIPPPKINNNAKKNICLFCNKPLANPTAMKCCGFAFCFGCANSFLEKEKKCFSCKAPINRNYLVKIFE